MWRQWLFPDDPPQGIRNWAIMALSIILGAFAIYTGYRGSLPGYEQRGFYFAIAFALIFLVRPFRRNSPGWSAVITDVVPALMSVGVGLYFATQYNNLVFRITMYTTLDMIVSVACVLLVLEGTRRTIGWALPILSTIALAYAIYGFVLPNPWGHGGFPPLRTVTFLSLGLDGIFGIPLDAAATYLIVYVLLGSLMEVSGTGDFILKLGQFLFGRFRGGSSKVAVVTSALFGTISGSAVANVVGTGTFTIPLMKREGYPGHVAAATEASASAGGQIMPPIMGASAFIMAEMIGIPYTVIAKAAIFPALLYFMGIFISVDLEAGKNGLRGLSRAERPKFSELTGGSTFFVPVVILLYLLFYVEFSPLHSAFYATMALLAICLIRSPKRFPALLMAGFRRSGTGGLEAAAATACAGIMVGSFDLTGLGMKLAGLLIQLANGQLLVLLILVALSCLVLGMGVPTTAAYIMVATMVAPALIRMDVMPMAAHLFVLYYAVISVVTPPVAVAAYAAAGIAGSDPWQTGLTAARIALPGFMIPFVFVYRPALLLDAEPGRIVFAALVGLLAIVALGVATTGYGLRRLLWWERILAGVAGIILFWPGLLMDAIGFTVLAGLLALQFFHRTTSSEGVVTSVRTP